MPLSIESVITVTTAAEIEAELLSILASVGLPTSSWQPGGVIRTLIAEIAEIVSRKSIVEVEIARGGLGDLTSGEWAKLWAQQIYDVVFVGARAATGYQTLTNGSADPKTLEVGELIVAHATTGMTYRNQVEVSVAAGATSAPFAIAADAVGTSGDAAPGEISRIVSPGSLIGFTTRNPESVLGADEEDTAALVKRTRLKLGSFSPRGPKGAYDFVARTPLDSFPAIDATGLLVPTSTPITRSRTTLDPVTGDVVTYLATSSGAPTSDDIDRVNAGFWRWAEPWGVRSRAAAASELVVPVSYQAWVRSTLTTAQVSAIVAAALGRFFSTIDIGGVVIPPDTGAVYTEALQFTIHTSVPGVQRVLVTVPAGVMQVVAQNQVPVLGTLTPTISFMR